MSPIRNARIETAGVCAAALAALAAWTLFAGKDVSWDLFNHHLYLPFSWLSGRHDADLFAVGPQSYQNPLGYLPGYGLVAAQWPAWSIGLTLTALQALPAAWALHRLALALWGPDAAARHWRWLAVGMALTAPVYLLTVGTTSTDPLCAALVLVALAGVIDARPHTRASLALGGAALGLAVAVKFTSGIFAIGIGLLLVWRLLSRQTRWSQALLFGAVAVLSTVVCMGAWSWWLWQHFGNPVFPLFNSLFGSPYAPAGPTVALRFLPDGAVGLLSRLWEMAEIRAYTTTEAIVPDARPLAAAVLAVLLAGAALVRRRRERPAAPVQTAWHTRADVQLALVVVLVYGVWMASSGNARYAVGWFVLAGLLMVRLLGLVLPGPRGLVLGLAVGVLQLGIYIDAGDRRFNPAPWDERPYVDIEVAPRLKEQPFLHLTIGVQSHGIAALALHPGGALINITGQVGLPTTGPLGERLQERLQHWKQRTRFLLPAPPPDSAPDVRARIRFTTYRYGLALDWSDCEPIVLKPWKGAVVPTASAPSNGHAPALALMSCGALPAPERDPDIERRVAQADRVFALLEAACPRIFGPRPFVSDIGSVVVQRLYMNSDARATVSDTDGVIISHYRSMSAQGLGTADEVIANGGRDACKAWSNLTKR